MDANLLEEFKKLQEEATGLNQRLQTTTSTLGCSTESTLLRQMLQELKLMRSEVVEVKSTQKTLLEDLGVIRQNVQNIEVKLTVQKEKLENVRESLSVQAKETADKAAENLNEQLRVIRENLDGKLAVQEEKLANLQESLTGQRKQEAEEFSGKLAVLQEKLDVHNKQDLEKLQNLLEKLENLQEDMAIVKNVRKKAQLIEKRQFDFDPILEAIPGSWKFASSQNSDAYLDEKCSENEKKWFESTLTVEVFGKTVSMKYEGGGPSWSHQIGDPNPKTSLANNHLIFSYEYAGEVYRVDDFSIKDGKLCRKEMAQGEHFERIYERI